MTTNDFNILLDDASKAFRLGMDAYASTLLTKIIDNIMNIIKEDMQNNELKDFSALIQDIMESQNRADYLYLADLLDFELRRYIKN